MDHDLTPDQKRVALDFLAAQYGDTDHLKTARGICNGLAASITCYALIALATVVALEILP